MSVGDNAFRIKSRFFKLVFLLSLKKIDNKNFEFSKLAQKVSYL